MIAATGLVILLKFDPNHWCFNPLLIICVSFQIHWWIKTEVTIWKRSTWVKIGNFLSRVTLRFDGWPWRTIGHLFYTRSIFVHHFKAMGELKLKLQPETLNSGQNRQFFVPCDLEIWWMTLENNRAPLLYQINLCASFQSHGWIQTGVTVRKCSIRVKIGNFLSRVTLKFDGWLWKTIGHLFYVASSFVHHFIAINEFKLELQSGNAQFGSKSMIFFSRVTLKFDGWLWKTIGHLFHATSSFVPHFVATGEFKLKLQSGNAQFESKSTIFLTVWPWNLTDDLEKQ